MSPPLKFTAHPSQDATQYAAATEKFCDKLREKHIANKPYGPPPLPENQDSEIRFEQSVEQVNSEARYALQNGKPYPPHSMQFTPADRYVPALTVSLEGTTQQNNGEKIHTIEVIDGRDGDRDGNNETIVLTQDKFIARPDGRIETLREQHQCVYDSAEGSHYVGGAREITDQNGVMIVRQNFPDPDTYKESSILEEIDLKQILTKDSVTL